ncbi:tripartite tricarboxylate transporter TctB family protein [Bacillus cereus]|uniref:tripartite tricarboxylate transporter TctB family protein n=2 Tax=Bacillus cereus group TaxID=86661 RepID=UPI0018F6FABC|nr:tripartite tricarboxylate transporter TctB family protein [Bacillus cereus]
MYGIFMFLLVLGMIISGLFIVRFHKRMDWQKRMKAIVACLGCFSVAFICIVFVPKKDTFTVNESKVSEETTSEEDSKKEEVTSSDEVKKDKEPIYKEYSTEEIKSLFITGMSTKEFDDKKEESKIKVRNYNNYNPAGLYTFDTKEGQIVAVVLNAKEVIKVETLNNQELLGNFIKDEENRMNEEKRIANEEANKKLKELYESKKNKMEGSGDSVTNKMQLNSGLVFFDFNNTGSRNFIVHLKDSSGNTIELLVNTIGNYSGKVSTAIPVSGEYYLEVKSSSNWNATVTQETPLVSEKVPGTINGHGDDVVFIDVPSGNHIVKLKHTGSRNFIVKVNDQNLLVNKIGAYEGSSSQVFENSGMYSFAIKADGDWSITIE